MLGRQNMGQLSSSLPVDQFLKGKSMNTLDVKRLALELSSKRVHDEVYVFSLPSSLSTRLAWVKLLAKVQRGEIEP